MLGDYKKASEDFSVAISINPHDAMAYYNRGLIYNRLGNIALANRDFSMAKSLGYNVK